ncbi:hypothetical protein IMSAG249_01414 [Lachnospiraceae bacterium]|jgi:hypothetical protein|nr:hypothetical protein IMSAGC009_03821 [Lachnospiraceae bacterium]GFI69591.1 hypothetical protein IMSAG249_01414 [Lachnospiraceae bacterium]
MKKGIVGTLSLLAGAAGGAISVGKISGEKIKGWHQLSDKHLNLFLMMNQWVKVKQEGKNLSSYFEKKEYKKIAVYGMSYAGETFVDELKNTGIIIAYGIDKNADTIYSDIDIFTMEDSLEEVDAVVVTAVTFFDEIEETLCGKLDCPIISLEDILYEV